VKHSPAGSSSNSDTDRAETVRATYIELLPPLAGEGGDWGESCLPSASNYLFNSGVEVRTSSPQELAAFIESEMQKWAKVVKDSGARAD